MKLTKKQQEYIKDAYNRACVDWKQEIKDNFPKLFENELEVGKWYKVKGTLGKETDALMCVESKRKCHGFNHYGEWTELYNRPENWLEENFKEATKEEVEKALIKEAKNREFEKVKKNFKDVDGGKNKNYLRFNDLFYSRSLNFLCDGWGNVIFMNGKWAEILPEAKEMTEEEISKELGYEVKVVK